MSNPFSNGSSVADLQRPARYHEPTAQQPESDYWRQQYSNQGRAELDLQRDIQRDQQRERGRSLAGFIQRDRRAEGLGFEWTRIRGAQWPERMPAAIAQQVEQSIAAERSARAAMAAAVTAYQLWAQQHPAASDELRRLEYERLTIDPAAAAQRADQQLDGVLTDAAAVTEAIEHWQEVEQAAPGRRNAEERRHAQALAAIETDVLAARVAAQRLGVQVQ